MYHAFALVVAVVPREGVDVAPRLPGLVVLDAAERPVLRVGLLLLLLAESALVDAGVALLQVHEQEQAEHHRQDEPLQQLVALLVLQVALAGPVDARVAAALDVAADHLRVVQVLQHLAAQPVHLRVQRALDEAQVVGQQHAQVRGVELQVAVDEGVRGARQLEGFELLEVGRARAVDVQHAPLGPDEDLVHAVDDVHRAAALLEGLLGAHPARVGDASEDQVLAVEAVDQEVLVPAYVEEVGVRVVLVELLFRRGVVE